MLPQVRPNRDDIIIRRLTPAISRELGYDPAQAWNVDTLNTKLYQSQYYDDLFVTCAMRMYNEAVGAKHIVYLAIDKVTQRVVGAISFFIDKLFRNPGSLRDSLEVDYLDAGIKSLGIGTKLMSRAIWYAMTAGLEKIQLYSVPESVNFYKGLGFVSAESEYEEDEHLLYLHMSRQPKPLLSWKQLTGTSPFFKVIQLLRSKRYLT
jgi:GNAT superfamily N-acetyltransferase